MYKLEYVIDKRIKHFYEEESIKLEIKIEYYKIKSIIDDVNKEIKNMVSKGAVYVMENLKKIEKLRMTNRFLNMIISEHEYISFSGFDRDIEIFRMIDIMCDTEIEYSVWEFIKKVQDIQQAEEDFTSQS